MKWEFIMALFLNKGGFSFNRMEYQASPVWSTVHRLYLFITHRKTKLWQLSSGKSLISLVISFNLCIFYRMVKVNSKKNYGKSWLRQTNQNSKGVSGLSGSSLAKITKNIDSRFCKRIIPPQGKSRENSDVRTSQTYANVCGNIDGIAVPQEHLSIRMSSSRLMLDSINLLRKPRNNSTWF